MSHSPTRRRLLPALLAVALAAVAVFGAAAPASAHDQLISTDPAADSVLDALPSQVTLTFNAELLPGNGNEVQVTDAAGASLNDGAAVVSGTTLVQPLTGNASGAVTVLWRAVSSDGHPISNQFSFTVTAAASPTPTGSASTSPTATPTATAVAPVQTATATPDPAPAGDGGSALPWIILAVVVVLAAGAVVFLLVSRARGNRDGGADGGSATGAER